MAQYGGELKKTDEFGKPVQHPTGGEFGGPHGAEHPRGAEHPHGAPISVPPSTGEPHHRRSDSSSSSEDDGQGGRRKKGMKDKVKEKLPGGHKETQPHTQPHHEPGYGGVPGQPEHEKKGMMDKIKEKIPGGHNN